MEEAEKQAILRQKIDATVDKENHFIMNELEAKDGESTMVLNTTCGSLCVRHPTLTASSMRDTKRRAILP